MVYHCFTDVGIWGKSGQKKIVMRAEHENVNCSSQFRAELIIMQNRDAVSKIVMTSSWEQKVYQEYIRSRIRLWKPRFPKS